MSTKVAFTMKLKAGAVEEYKKRHDEVWPEVQALLHEHGISDFSIFVDEPSLTLFAIQNVSTNPSSPTAALKDTEVMKRWWKYMSDIMETNSDHSPVTQHLRLVYHLD